jgi:large subunit ribosomal protein L31
MKEKIHPQYVESTVTCVCGHTFKTMSTRPVIRLEVCSNCHPFFTGKQKLVDSGGRVEKFKKKYESVKVEDRKKKKKVLSDKVVGKRTLSTSPKKVKVVADPRDKSAKPKEKKVIAEKKTEEKK